MAVEAKRLFGIPLPLRGREPSPNSPAAPHILTIPSQELPQDVTARDLRMMRLGREAAEQALKELEAERRAQAVKDRRRSSPLNSIQLSRRTFVRGLGATAATALAAGAGSVIRPIFVPGMKDLLMLNDQHIVPQVDRSGIMQIKPDANEIPTSVNPIEHNSWSNEVDVEENIAYSEQFPDHELTYDFETKSGEDLGSITFKGDEVITEGYIRKDRNEDGDNSLQINAFPTEQEDTVIVNFREDSETLGLLTEEQAEVPIQAYTYTPEDPTDHPRVFSEVDVDTLHPEKDILRRAHEIAKRFDGLIPDVTVSLYDASDTVYTDTSPDYFYDSKKKRVRIPVQYWTEPAYAQQDTLTLHRALNYAALTSNEHDLSSRSVELGDFENMLVAFRNEDEDIRLQQIEDFRKASRDENAPVPFAMFPTGESELPGLEPKRYDPNLATEPIFSANQPVPKYLEFVTDGMTILENFGGDFTMQFFIDNPSHQLHLSPLQQNRALTAGQQLFRILDTFTSDENNLRILIPNYDYIRDFVFAHQVMAD